MWWHRQLFHPRHTPKISVCSFINRRRENKCAVNVKMFWVRSANSLVSVPPAKLPMELSCSRHLGEVYWELLSICKMSTNITTVVSSDDLQPLIRRSSPTPCIMPAWNKHHHGDPVALKSLVPTDWLPKTEWVRVAAFPQDMLAFMRQSCTLLLWLRQFHFHKFN